MCIVKTFFVGYTEMLKSRRKVTTRVCEVAAAIKKGWNLI
jgi:hypothetical protein